MSLLHPVTVLCISVEVENKDSKNLIAAYTDLSSLVECAVVQNMLALFFSMSVLNNSKEVECLLYLHLVTISTPPSPTKKEERKKKNSGEDQCGYGLI